MMMDGKVVVSELAEQYEVTEETIRRDLEKLEADGQAKKTYGGAVRNDNMTSDLPYIVRKQTNVGGKKYIAERIGELIGDGDSLLLDASTTALFTVKSIFHKQNLTIITNSVAALLEMPQGNDWNIISTGGLYRPDATYYYGRVSEESVSRYNVDYAILSCKGLDMTKGVTDTREMIADLKKTFLTSAKEIVLAVDHTKFDQVSFVNLCGFDRINTVVTDVEPSEAWKNFFAEKQIRLIY